MLVAVGGATDCDPSIAHLSARFESWLLPLSKNDGFESLTFTQLGLVLVLVGI